MLLKVSQFTQMVVGYLVLSAAVDVCLDFVMEVFVLWNIGRYKILAFTLTVFWLKVELHPENELTPFAFKVVSRWSKEN